MTDLDVGRVFPRPDSVTVPAGLVYPNIPPDSLTLPLPIPNYSGV